MTDLALFGFGPAGWGAALLRATLVTLGVAVSAFAIGAVLGAVVAATKLSGSRALRAAGDAYTTVLRGVPDLLVIYLVYFGGSAIVTRLGQAMGAEGFLGLPSFLAGALACGLVSGAYQAEVFRGAALAVPRGQVEAARALGMDGGLRFRRILAPQIVAIALPGLGNVWQLALKESALVSVTGLVELLRQSQIGAGSTHQPFAFYVAAGALYLVLTTGSTLLFGRAEWRMSRSLRRL
ncbi:ABC transporter permease [Lichenibacterium ramalinae]|uniref:ABC transporter permease subunit n=1 Tax=Lichenibacterium ramalinae TaxID=2316527 RepID=A0A4Q2RF07_9HYPH|nr:ABC transporter permease subunit [Lichenibacterium ramalinae]RYB06256.1 ABC transporter permease subunit [Lichenibacterium ramalinae]